MTYDDDWAIIDDIFIYDNFSDIIYVRSSFILLLSQQAIYSHYFSSS
jgi:hypothetical protein